MPPDPSLPLEEFFETLFRAEYAHLCRYAAVILKKQAKPADPQRIEEAVQEAFLLAWKKPDALLRSPNPGGWMAKTVGNVLRNMLREDLRWTLRLAQLTQGTDLHTPAPGADLELEGFVSPENLSLLKRHYLDGESYDSLAQELGINRSALAMRLKRARETFRKNYLTPDTGPSEGQVQRGGSYP